MTVQTIREHAIATQKKQKEGAKAVECDHERAESVELDCWLQAVYGATLAEFRAEDIEPRLGRHDGKRCLQIRGVCPRCGEYAWSKNILNWSDLGLMLKEFTMPYPTPHHCPDYKWQKGFGRTCV